MIEAVFFDLFETLLSLYNPLRPVGPSIAERLGLDPAAFDAHWRLLRRLRYVGAFPDYRDALRGISRTLHATPDERVIEQLYEERRAIFLEACARTSDEVVALLARLRGLGIRLPVISNSVAEFVEGWPQSPIRPLVDDVVFSHEVGCAKPQPEIYLLAARRAGVAPARSIFVGDGDNDELAGAAQVGMRPYWATWFLDRWPPQARAGSGVGRSAGYQRLRAPADLLREVTPIEPRSAAPRLRD